MDVTCPKCQASMRSYERNGVTVDQCGECRGIFLDRGELERLVDAEAAWQGDSAPAAAPAAPAPTSYPPAPPQQQYGQPQQHGRPQHGDGKPHKKRRSFLEELFD